MSRGFLLIYSMALQSIYKALKRKNKRLREREEPYN